MNDNSVFVSRYPTLATPDEDQPSSGDVRSSTDSASRTSIRKGRSRESLIPCCVSTGLQVGKSEQYDTFYSLILPAVVKTVDKAGGRGGRLLGHIKDARDFLFPCVKLLIDSYQRSAKSSTNNNLQPQAVRAMQSTFDRFLQDNLPRARLHRDTIHSEETSLVRRKSSLTTFWRKLKGKRTSTIPSSAEAGEETSGKLDVVSFLVRKDSLRARQALSYGWKTHKLPAWSISSDRHGDFSMVLDPTIYRASNRYRGGERRGRDEKPFAVLPEHAIKTIVSSALDKWDEQGFGEGADGFSDSQKAWEDVREIQQYLDEATMVCLTDGIPRPEIRCQGLPVLSSGKFRLAKRSVGFPSSPAQLRIMTLAENKD